MCIVSRGDTAWSCTAKRDVGQYVYRPEPCPAQVFSRSTWSWQRGRPGVWLDASRPANAPTTDGLVLALEKFAVWVEMRFDGQAGAVTRTPWCCIGQKNKQKKKVATNVVRTWRNVPKDDDRYAAV